MGGLCLHEFRRMLKMRMKRVWKLDFDQKSDKTVTQAVSKVCRKCDKTTYVSTMNKMKKYNGQLVFFCAWPESEVKLTMAFRKERPEYFIFQLSKAL